MNFLKSLSKWYRGFNFSVLLILTLLLVMFSLIQVLNLNSFVNIKNGKSKDYDNELQNDEVVYYLNMKKADFDGEKLIHFDLKGAPPKISYLLKFIPFIKTLGATGILIEYEDMFPYHNGLEEITALNAYTLSDIAAIVRTAEVHNLTIIPLVPTLSHFEFVLKLKQYKKFREVGNNPQVLCPSQEKIYSVLKKMINQVLEAHNTSDYLHIGCDEAQYLGVCPKCQQLMKRNKWRKDNIYFDHVRKIAEYIIQSHPRIRPIIWGDKVTKPNRNILVRHGIPDLVDVMLWNYKPEKSFFPSKEDMNSLTKLFKSIWIANAFKGATGSTKIITNAEYHLRNTERWMELVEEWKYRINFKGIALTGWQRYNHFMVLCELLPVGIPSLALNLQYITKKKGTDYDEIKHILNCNDFVPVTLQDIQDVMLLSRLQCDFLGFRIYHIIHFFFNALLQLKVPLAKLNTGDLTFYTVLNALNPVYIHDLNKKTYEQYLVELEELESKIRSALEEVYDQPTIREWIMTYVMPVRMRLEAAINIINSVGSIKVWPRRPFLNDELQARKFFNKICNKNETTGCTFLTFTEIF